MTTPGSTPELPAAAHARGLATALALLEGHPSDKLSVSRPASEKVSPEGGGRRVRAEVLARGLVSLLDAVTRGTLI